MWGDKTPNKDVANGPRQLTAFSRVVHQFARGPRNANGHGADGSDGGEGAWNDGIVWKHNEANTDSSNGVAEARGAGLLGPLIRCMPTGRMLGTGCLIETLPAHSNIVGRSHSRGSGASHTTTEAAKLISGATFMMPTRTTDKRSSPCNRRKYAFCLYTLINCAVTLQRSTSKLLLCNECGGEASRGSLRQVPETGQWPGLAHSLHMPSCR